MLIGFSEALDPTTVNAGTVVVSVLGVPLAGELTLEQEGRAVRYRVADLYTFAPNTFYQVTVTPAVTDTAGNALAQAFVSGFTTGDAPDTVVPEVVSVTPAHLATEVSPLVVVEVVFTEPVDPVTVNADTVMVGLSYYGPYVSGALSVAPDGARVTFVADDPLFAGYRYYVVLEAVEDLAGNLLAKSYTYFNTAVAPGTDVGSLPTSATVVANPERLFADGLSTTTVQVTNISRNGVLVPNGTQVAVTAAPAFRTDTAGGEILGGTVSAADARFKVFSTIGGAVTLTYRSVDLPGLAPGTTSSAYLQVAAVDAAQRPVDELGRRLVYLFRGRSAAIDLNPVSLLADGSSYSQVGLTVLDVDSRPVPPGVGIGLTAAAAYRADSLGGTILGGEAIADVRFRVFDALTGGLVDTVYVAPVLAAYQSGKGWVQAVEVNSAGQVTGLLGEKAVTLSGSAGYTAPQPRVLSVSPEHGQTEVALNALVVAEFSQALDAATLIAANFSVKTGATTVPGSLGLSEGVNGPATVVTFAPDNPWSPNSSYNVYIGTGIRSQAGSPLLAAVSVSFSTGFVLVDDVPPQVVGANPPDGATGVGRNASVAVAFSEPLRTASVNAQSLRLTLAGEPVAGRVEKLGATVYAFIPDALLAPDAAYLVTIDSSVADTAGNPMGGDFAFGFTTQVGIDNYQPSVIEVGPYDDQQGVALNSAIRLAFDERVDPLSVDGASFYVKYSAVSVSRLVEGQITVAPDGLSATLLPSQPLVPNTWHYIYYQSGITDVAGNPLFNPTGTSYSLRFYTGVELADVTPPGWWVWVRSTGRWGCP